MEKPKKTSPSISIEDLKKVFCKWLILKDGTLIDVVMATVLANKLNSDPTWMLIVGPPSSAKTELLNTTNGLEKTFFLSSLTPQTFISGKQKKDDEPSLLFRINGKVLVMKDFTTVLTMRQEPRAEILSQLREIYDGQFSKAFGTGSVVKWRGKVGFLAGVTPIIDKYSAVNQILGERFLQFRVSAESPIEVAQRARQMVGKETKMRGELQGVVTRFFKQFNQMDLDFTQDDSVNNQIDHLACLCAVARTGVSRDRISKTIDFMPQAEGPARLTKQFTQIGIGLAIAHSKNRIDAFVYEIIKKIGRDTLPSMRLSILQTMWEEGWSEDVPSWEKTSSIAETLGLPTTTVTEQLENFMVLGLLNRRLGAVDGGHANKYFWQISLSGVALIEKSGIFDKDESVEGVPF